MSRMQKKIKESLRLWNFTNLQDNHDSLQELNAPNLLSNLQNRYIIGEFSRIFAKSPELPIFVCPGMKDYRSVGQFSKEIWTSLVLDSFH